MSDQQQQPILFNIRLNLDQINVILSTVGKLPYESIAPLMNSIQAQANKQLQEMQEQQAQPAAEEVPTPSTMQ